MGTWRLINGKLRTKINMPLISKVIAIAVIIGVDAIPPTTQAQKFSGLQIS
jgi:hypothetical protein